jgi:hypothetical protein
MVSTPAESCMNDVRLAGKVKAAGAFDRKLLLSGLTTSRKDATLPIAAFDAAMRLVPGFAVNMPPERILQFATEVWAEWEDFAGTKPACVRNESRHIVKGGVLVLVSTRHLSVRCRNKAHPTARDS